MLLALKWVGVGAWGVGFTDAIATELWHCQHHNDGSSPLGSDVSHFRASLTELEWFSAIKPKGLADTNITLTSDCSVHFSALTSWLDHWGGGGGMRMDSTKILFQTFLFFRLEAIVSSSGTGKVVHSLTLSIQHFLCRPRCRPSSNLPCMMVLGRLSWRVTCPNRMFPSLDCEWPQKSLDMVSIMHTPLTAWGWWDEQNTAVKIFIERTRSGNGRQVGHTPIGTIP